MGNVATRGIQWLTMMADRYVQFSVAFFPFGTSVSICWRTRLRVISRSVNLATGPSAVLPSSRLSMPRILRDCVFSSPFYSSS